YFPQAVSGVCRIVRSPQHFYARWCRQRFTSGSDSGGGRRGGQLDLEPIRGGARVAAGRPGVAMKPALLDILACPRCKESLDLRTDAGDGIEVHQGTLRCPMCRRNYRITGGIPRFVEAGSYAASFGRQWHWFPRVQLDSQSGSDESARALEATTGWTEADYRGRLVLDAG